jgi:5-methylthioadenosine/S-adenosylhomocysteine deaminase
MDDAFGVVDGAISIRDGRIASVGPEPSSPHDVVVDAAGGYLLPGFVQTHVHLCQTLFRGYADDLRLMDWLRTRIWPMEAAHTPASLRAAARLACHELLRSGTTTALTMETVHDTEAVIDAVAETGIRAAIGKCLMDDSTPGAPARLREPAARALDEAIALHARYDGSSNGRMRIAFAPRFALSCSPDLLGRVAAAARERGALIHTHASEQLEEIAMVRAATGRGNIAYLRHVGLTSPATVIAHCVWVDEADQAMLAADDVKVAHCPGSNLKLGSGLAPVPELLSRGICVSLGADGAACNNHLDMFGEMRLAATLQAIRKGPGALPARQALWMATRNGARALGLEGEIGSIEPGKKADLVLVDAAAAHLAPGPDPYSTVVYACRPGDVRMVMVDGELLIRDGEAVQVDAREIAATARAEAALLARRAGL